MFGRRTTPVDAQLEEVKRAHPGYVIRTRRAPTPRNYVTVWLVASFLAGTFPVGITWMHLSKDPEKTVTFNALLGDGELLLITVVLMIAGLGELVLKIRDTSASPIGLALFLLSCSFLLVLAALWYGELSGLQPGDAGAFPEAAVAWGSLMMYLAAGILTSRCVWLAADAEVE